MTRVLYIPTHPPSQAKDQYEKGVVFYLRDGKVVGMLLWNLFDKMPTARKILKDGRRVSDVRELAKLLSVHE